MDNKDFLKSIAGNGSASLKCYSLPALAAAKGAKLERLPVCLRVVLESLLRNLDGKAVTEEHVDALLAWEPKARRSAEIPFKVGRVVLQDFTGVPLLVDLAAMRDAAKDWDGDASVVEPLVPVDLVVDHSVQVDNYGSKDALRLNLAREFERNEERYRFLKWGMGAFKSFKVVPPGVGIVHQVNLEHLAPGLIADAADPALHYPDSLVGTDSHTTMINGIGVVGWGVGGIEAEAAMLGQPVYILTPDVVGVHLSGKLREGRTATDLVLTIVEMLRKTNVVGKFVEFYGEGAASLSVPDRATISNMAPEYGATIGYFPADAKTMEYFANTGRDEATIARCRAYLEHQKLYGVHDGGVEYSQVLELDLGSVVPSVAGPKRPQDRIVLPQLKERFAELLAQDVADGGYGRSAAQRAARHATAIEGVDVGDGDVLIAAITSCTNTSNPAVLIAAGLVARKAAALGLKVHKRVKTSLAPGSRVVTDYLAKTGLDKDLEALGFFTVGYGCTTCIGNSGPVAPEIEEKLTGEGVVAASVLSGNRNFEARVHPNIRANFLMSPPLVVAFALAGTVNIDLDAEPLAEAGGKPVHLRDIWPTDAEIQEMLGHANNPAYFRQRYASYEDEVPMWREIAAEPSVNYDWDGESTYIRKPPFLELGDELGGVSGARALAILGDSVTTDHISPAGSIGERSPAGSYLKDNKVSLFDFNSYGSRRGNHEVMMRGTFANVRIRNLMAPGTEGGVTVHQPSGEGMPIYDAARRYQEEGVPLLLFAGSEYGSGSSRDWAAKGTRLLGVRAVIASSFERIHRSNLVGMGVLPLVFAAGDSVASLGLDGTETYAVEGIGTRITPQQDALLRVSYADGRSREVPLTVRVDTPNEADCFASGGILKHVLRRLVESQAAA